MTVAQSPWGVTCCSAVSTDGGMGREGHGVGTGRGRRIGVGPTGSDRAGISCGCGCRDQSRQSLSCENS